jgi:hypothetical protein
MQKNEKPGEAAARHSDHREREMPRWIGEEPVNEIPHVVTLG